RRVRQGQFGGMERHSAPGATTAGEILLDVGAEPRGIFVVSSGTVEILLPFSSDVRSKACEWAFLNLLTPGDFSGEMSTLRGAAGLARLPGPEPGAVPPLSRRRAPAEPLEA